MVEDETTVIGVRVPRSLSDMVNEYIAKDTHLNSSDFMRDAIREKIKRDAPELYKRMFGEGKK